MKNKKILTILTAIAFIVSGCTGNTQSSSIAPSTPSTTSEVSSNPSSDTSTSTSSADSTSATSSNTSTSTTTSSSTTSSSSASSSSSSTTSSSYIPSGDTTWNINISLRGAEFRNALQTIMAGKRTRTTDYSSCKSIGAKAAAYPNANSMENPQIYNVPEASKFPINERKSFGGPGSGRGPSKACECPKCGYTAPKIRGFPCRNIKCPECGTPLCGSNYKQEN